jgi:hypothetical protein
MNDTEQIKDVLVILSRSTLTTTPIDRDGDSLCDRSGRVTHHHV